MFCLLRWVLFNKHTDILIITDSPWPQTRALYSLRSTWYFRSIFLKDQGGPLTQIVLNDLIWYFRGLFLKDQFGPLTGLRFNPDHFSSLKLSGWAVTFGVARWDSFESLNPKILFFSLYRCVY